jgi:beta-glucanase (GH16 family)
MLAVTATVLAIGVAGSGHGRGSAARLERHTSRDWLSTWRPGVGSSSRLRGGEALALWHRGPAAGALRLNSPLYPLRAGDRLTATAELRSSAGDQSGRLRILSMGRTRHVLAHTSAAVRASGWTRVRLSYLVGHRPAPIRVRIAATGGGRRHLLVRAVRTRITPRSTSAATSPPTSPAYPTSPPTSPVTDPTHTPCQRLDYSQPGQGVLAWSDEFDGNSLDGSRWNVRDGESLSYDQARIMRGNVAVHHGMLDITARRQDVAGRHYTSGYVDTLGRYSRQWGRWEMRAKLPTTVGTSRGIWPAFWLRADHAPGEIDVAEAWGEPTARPGYRSGSYQWTVHQDTNSGPGTQHLSGWGTAAGQPPVANAFHLYAVDWSPDCVVFSLDHHVVGIVQRAQAPWLGTSFASPVNIRLNLQVGQDYWGYPDPKKPGETVLPATLEVDYVRVYRPLWTS